MAGKAKSKEKNLVYIFNYLFSWLSGIVVYITVGQKDKRLKFHSVQAIMLGLVMFVLAYVPILNLVGVLLWIYGLVIGFVAYDEGRDIEIPIIGEYAKRYSK